MTEGYQQAASLQLLEDKSGNNQSWPLSGKNTYQLGREAGNDIALPYSWVSRKHAMIQVEENGNHNLIDLGSANGTFVNGRRIYTPTALKNGDIIRIGNTSLSFHQEQAPRPVVPHPYDDADDRTVAFVQQEIVTILICDIHDYTSLSERLGDSQISKLLQHWTTQVGSLIRNRDGIIDKFIGDAVMAIWPGGENLSQSIKQALIAALEISVFTKKMGQKIPNLPWELNIGAALNTGQAMVGNLGIDGQRDFTVVGDVVNVAFRLEEMTSQQDGLDVIIGASTASHLENVDNFFSSQTYSCKGKEEPVAAYGCSFTQLHQYLKSTHKK